jgi:hypothetical protein
VPPLNFLDKAETYNLLVALCIGYLMLEEENCALLLLTLTRVHIIEEDQFVICHAHQPLAIAERSQDFARALYYDFPRWGFVCKKLLL